MAKENQTKNAPEVKETLNKQEAFLVKNGKKIVIGIVAVVAVIAAVLAYNTFIAAPKEDKASTALAKAQELFAEQQYDKALKGDKGVEGFIALADNYSGTDAGNLAKLYAGLCYAKTEKWEDAVKYLDDFSAQDDAMISPAAVAALGDAYAHTNNVDKAISCFKKAADMADDEAADGANSSLSPTFLIKAARLLESQQKNDEALKIYKSVKEKYVNSAISQEIDKYIERLAK